MNEEQTIGHEDVGEVPAEPQPGEETQPMEPGELPEEPSELPEEPPAAPTAPDDSPPVPAPDTSPPEESGDEAGDQTETNGEE